MSLNKSVHQRSSMINDAPAQTILKKLIVVSVGGDGSFMNILKEMEDYGIHLKSIIFTQFPFGTANDLSRAFKWGKTPSRKMKTDLRYLWDELNTAKETGFDIWEINIHTDPNSGDIEYVDGNDLVSFETRTFKKLMCHSFSFGLDARVGLNFERKRTRSRVWNQIRYGWEGLKRVFCWWCARRTLKIREILSKFYQTPSEENREDFKEISQDDDTDHQGEMEKQEKEGDIEKEADIEKQPIRKEELNTVDFTIGTDKKEENTYYLRGNPVSLYCTNIATLMGGRNNVWRGGRNRSGITDKNGYAIPPYVFNDNVSYNDGKLEFSTFKTMFHLIFQRSRRVMQSGGPFVFDFKDSKLMNLNATSTYINIDGEFYHVTDISKLTIEKYFKDEPLRILVNERD